ncbi:MAG: peptide ABC transporter substrate-binding protein [Phycisphaerae bacterium]|jgi:oligopeptide transport system substrate-binding protein|nr:MAG: peptide ABC transporter substrate-binding protein [Phycisphaerae bacterium]
MCIRSILIYALILLGTGIGLISCDRRSDRPAGEFRFVNRGDIITLDLNNMSYLQDFRVTNAIREGLYTFDPETFRPVSALAIEDSVSSDGRTWTFKLRPDARWDNGDPVVAEDFIFSWKLLLESPGEYTYLLHYIEGAEEFQQARTEGKEVSFDQTVGVEAPDSHTLIVRLVNPVPFFRDLMAFPTFFPRHARSMEPFKVTDAQGRVGYRPEYTRPPHVVTNGPFKLVKWESGRLLRMEPNEYYWDRASVKLRAIENIVTNDPQSAFLQYENGEVDWLADVSQDIAYPLKEKGRSDLRTAPAFGTAFITVNCAPTVPELNREKNPFSDPRVRTAVSMAIDRERLITSVTRMGEKPALHYMPPGFFEGYQARPIRNDGIETARKLLAEAGYPDGKGFPTVSLIYNSDNTIRRDLAASISNQLRTNLGINVESKGIELKSYRSLLTGRQYTLGLAAWFGDYMDPSTFMDKYLSNSENNDSNWGPSEYDELIARARREVDPGKRYDLLGQAESMINAELPIIPLYHYVNISLYRDNVKGLYTNAKNLTLFKTISVER